VAALAAARATRATMISSFFNIYSTMLRISIFIYKIRLKTNSMFHGDGVSTCTGRTLGCDYFFIFYFIVNSITITPVFQKFLPPLKIGMTVPVSKQQRSHYV